MTSDGSTSESSVHDQTATGHARNGETAWRLGIEAEPLAGPSKRRSRHPETGANREVLRIIVIERSPHILDALMC